MKHVYIKVTKDKYEHIIAMGDTVKELAEQLGTSRGTINSMMSHAKAKGKPCVYKKVVIE